MADAPLKAALTLGREGAARIGGDRIRLLGAIEAEGSIAGAARAAGLSYKAAWDAVTAMNNLFAAPLVSAAPGGRRGGGATLTDSGRALIAGFGALDAAFSRALATLDGALADDPATAQTLMWSLMMQTSTRNAFRCRVTGVTEGPVSARVTLALTDGQDLTAVITEKSAAEMGIAEGAEVFALVKSSAVILSTGEGAVSACNRLRGTVAARSDGPVNSEITLDLGGGKSLTAVVTRTSAEALNLTHGAPATAFFKASQVIVAVP